MWDGWNFVIWKMAVRDYNGEGIDGDGLSFWTIITQSTLALTKQKTRPMFIVVQLSVHFSNLYFFSLTYIFLSFFS